MCTQRDNDTCTRTRTRTRTRVRARETARERQEKDADIHREPYKGTQEAGVRGSERQGVGTRDFDEGVVMGKCTRLVIR